jgi:hypothetical protein
MEPGPKIAIDKQVHAQERDEIGKRPAKTCFHLEILQNQNRDQCCPNLNPKGVGPLGRHDLYNSEGVPGSAISIFHPLISNGSMYFTQGCGKDDAANGLKAISFKRQLPGRAWFMDA